MENQNKLQEEEFNLIEKQSILDFLKNKYPSFYKTLIEQWKKI